MLYIVYFVFVEDDMLSPAGVKKLYVSLQSLQVPSRYICGIARTLTWYSEFFLKWSMSIFKDNCEMF